MRSGTCTNDRPEELRLRAQVDPHSPAQYRINGVMVNMPEFAEAFTCKRGADGEADRKSLPSVVTDCRLTDVGRI